MHIAESGVAPAFVAGGYADAPALALLYGFNHFPPAQMPGIGAEGRAEARAAEIAAESLANFAETERDGPLPVLFGLEDHPALNIKEDAAHMAEIAVLPERTFRRGKHGNGIAQDGEIQRQDEQSLILVLLVKDGGAETQHLKTRALHGPLERQRRIDDFQRLSHMHMIGRVPDFAHVEGAADGLPGHVDGDGHNFAVMVDEKKTVVAVARHEGDFAIMNAAGLCAKAQPVVHGLSGDRARSQNEQLIARFCENLLKDKRNGTGP